MLPEVMDLSQTFSHKPVQEEISIASSLMQRYLQVPSIKVEN
jgi:hypothetical protein